MSQINFLEVLSGCKKIIWPQIDQYLQDFIKFPDYCQIPAKYDPLKKLHYDMVSDYPKRQGKYLRPALVLLTAQSMGVPLEKAIKTAVAMQLSEEWILAHDDIEDDSQSRRGAPTLHLLYGKELAINAGDNLQTIQWKPLFDNFSLLDHQTASRIVEEFYIMFNRTFLGQTIDIKWNQDTDIVLTDEDVYLTLESKTGYYTIAGPMRLGGILAGAAPKQLDVIYQFGVLLGRVFQITDDILDLTSDFSGLKKQQGNDIYENKKTIMLVHLIKNVKGEDKVKLAVILTKKRADKSPQEVEYVIKLMEKYGSLDYARQAAAGFAKQSLDIFDHQLDFIKNQPYRDQIRAGVDFIINRQH